MSHHMQEQFVLPPLELRDVLQYAVLLTVDEGTSPVVRTLLPTFQIVLLFALVYIRRSCKPATETQNLLVLERVS